MENEWNLINLAWQCNRPTHMQHRLCCRAVGVIAFADERKLHNCVFTQNMQQAPPRSPEPQNYGKKNASDSDKPPAPHKSNRAAKFTLKNSRGEFGLFCYAHTAVLSIEGIAHPADGSGCRDPPYQSF